jgi:general stress protein 26
MDLALRSFILDLLQTHEVLTLATVREDGWPQATSVGYVNEGLMLYVATGAHAQKVLNIRRSEKVSVAIDRGKVDWRSLQGLSMAALAEVLTSRSEIQRVARLVKKKFPTLIDFSDPERDRGWAFLKIVPQVISVIDYSKGFGHTMLVKL